MKHTAAALLILAAASLHAQTVVQAGKRVQLSAPGTTSAVSLDAKIADASAVDGIISITGISPGDTRVAAIRWDGIEEFRIHVTPAPPAYPPGFVAPQITSANTGGGVEFRYSSDRTQLESALDLYSQMADRTRQLHVVTAALTSAGQHNVYVPSAYYRIASGRLDTTFLDQTVDSSALTLQGVVLRGLHIKDGAWQFHGGYTTSAIFQNVFLPAEREVAAGLGYTEKVNSFLKITPSVYFLRSIDLADGQQRSAMIGSLLFAVHLAPGWQMKSEVAYGRGMAWAAALEHASLKSNLKARLARKDIQFPSVRMNSLPGLTGEVSWSQTINQQLGLVAGATVNRIELTSSKQDSESAYTNLRYRLSRSWSIGSGASYGSFSNPGLYSAKTLTLPQSINFDSKHFGAGFQYQISTLSNSFSNGSGFRQTGRLTLGRFQIGEFFDWQNDALSVNSLFSQIPGLQQELARLGINAVTPDQLAALLQDATFLQALGLSSQARIVTVPRRLQEGANLSWDSSGARPHHLSLAFIENHNQFSTFTTNDYNVTGSYTKQIGGSNQIQISGSFLRTGIAGQPQFTPVVSASFRHTFSQAPALFAAKSGTISGTVFIDSPRRGTYQKGMETVAKAVVVLDGRRTVLTDQFGHFQFGAVPAGDHQIQLQYKSDRAHYFTTPDATTVASGSNIDFGIAFPKLDLWGYVQDDTGNGLENVTLKATWPAGKTFFASTDHSGKFILPDVQPGRYQVQVEAETVAPGYDTDELAAIDINVTADSSGHPVMKIPANRVLTGTVTIYDPAAAGYVPLKGAVVLIPQLEKQVATNAAGKFTFGRLPAGDLEITVTTGKTSFTHTVTVPVYPVTLRDDFRISPLNGQIVSTLVNIPK